MRPRSGIAHYSASLLRIRPSLKSCIPLIIRFQATDGLLQGDNLADILRPFGPAIPMLIYARANFRNFSLLRDEDSTLVRGPGIADAHWQAAVVEPGIWEFHSPLSFPCEVNLVVECADAERVIPYPQILQLRGKTSRVHFLAFLPAWLSLFDLLSNFLIATVKYRSATAVVQCRLGMRSRPDLA